MGSSHYLYRLRFKRAQTIGRLCGLNIFSHDRKQSLNILEVGCGKGLDFIRFLDNYSNVVLFGKDRDDWHILQNNFKFILGDIESLEFPDKYFDLTISLGVLEHIQPIEKLAKTIKEINRVSKSYVVAVPSVDNILETHTASLFWQLRDHNRKPPYGPLLYFSDEAWLQFEGFNEAKTLRKYFIFPVTKSLFIYKAYPV